MRNRIALPTNMRERTTPKSLNETQCLLRYDPPGNVTCTDPTGA